MQKRLLLICVLLSTGSTYPALGADKTALALRWNSYAKLGIPMGYLTKGTAGFSLVALMLPVYRTPHLGALFGASGSTGIFGFGQWYTSRDDQTGSWAHPAVGVVLGPLQKQFDADGRLQIGKWNHFALTFSPGAIGWKIYLNGDELGSVPDSGWRPSGELWSGMIFENDRLSQAYGLVDDLGIYSRPLSALEVKEQAFKRILNGALPGFIAGWSFTSGSDSLLTDQPTPVLVGNSVEVPVSINRASTDQLNYPEPVQSAKHYLPFDSNDEYYVIQGNSGNGHHWGPWAFTWDFIFAGTRCDSLSTRQANNTRSATLNFNTKYGAGRLMNASAGGNVVYASWNHIEGDGSSDANRTMIRHAPGEYSSLFHLRKDSFPTLFPWDASRPITIDQTKFEQIDVPNANMTGFPSVINWGKTVGSMGGTGMGTSLNSYHLHFGMLNQPDHPSFPARITRPMYFDTFEYSLDRINWTLVRGIPQEGWYIRHKPPRMLPYSCKPY